MVYLRSASRYSTRRGSHGPEVVTVAEGANDAQLEPVFVSTNNRYVDYLLDAPQYQALMV